MEARPERLSFGSEDNVSVLSTTLAPLKAEPFPALLKDQDILNIYSPPLVMMNSTHHSALEAGAELIG